eukprot:m.809091 g.809091  ORF g.809091 m.809091 type:complete len:110 (-) comp23382_c0_seq5:3996-4325(-)
MASAEASLVSRSCPVSPRVRGMRSHLCNSRLCHAHAQSSHARLLTEPIFSTLDVDTQQLLLAGRQRAEVRCQRVSQDQMDLHQAEHDAFAHFSHSVVVSLDHPGNYVLE